MDVSAAQYCWLRMHTFTVLALVLLPGQLAVQATRIREVEEIPVLYCVAKPDADTTQLQEALDWTCGRGNSLGSVDCSAIQTGGPCFEPDTLANHASYAFTLYYFHQNAASHACDFKGLATLTSSNPSSGTCNYPAVGKASEPSTPDGGLTMSPPMGSSSLPFLSSSPAPSPNEASTTIPIFPMCLLVYAQVLLACLLPLPKILL